MEGGVCINDGKMKIMIMMINDTNTEEKVTKVRSNRLACYRCYYSITLAVLSLLALLKESVTRKGRQLNYYRISQDFAFAFEHRHDHP